MYSPVSLALFLATFIATVRPKSSFSQPPARGPEGDYSDNPTYEVGEKIDVQWTSDFETINLVLWQQYPSATETTFYYIMLLENSTSTSGLSWIVSLDDLVPDVAGGENVVLYLMLAEGGSPIGDAFSHYFNVSLPATETSFPSTATAGSTSATAVTGEASLTSTSDATESSSTATAEPESVSNSGLSTGAVAGITASAMIGGMLTLIGLGFLAWKHFRKGHTGGQHTQTQQAPLPKEHKPELADEGCHNLPQPKTLEQGPRGLYEAP